MNKTGAQVQRLLDTFLYRSIEHIIKHTDVFDAQIASILSFITTNKKRKVLSMDREEGISVLCKILTTEDREEKFELLKSLGLERYIIQVFVRNFLEAYQRDFMDLYPKFFNDKKVRERYRAKLNVILKSTGCNSRSEFFMLLTAAEYNERQYSRVFSDTTKQYVKLCAGLAKKHTSSKAGNYDQYDVRQRMLKSVVTALNKYDSSRGALTSYVKWWIFNATTCQSSECEYGIAYSLPQNVKRSMTGGNSNHIATNFSVSLDTLTSGEDDGSMHDILKSDLIGVTDQIESDSALKNLAILYKRTDRLGYGRLVLETPEHFTKLEKRKMLKHMRRHKLHKDPQYAESVKNFEKKHLKTKE